MCQSSVVRAYDDGIKLGLASLLLSAYTMWPTFTVYRMAPLLAYISTVRSAYRCLRNSRLVDITPYPSHPSHPSCFRPAGPRKEPGKNLTTARRHITMSDYSGDDEGHRRRKSSKGNNSAIQTLGYLSEISTGAELMMSSTAFEMANVWVGRKTGLNLKHVVLALGIFMATRSYSHKSMQWLQENGCNSLEVDSNEPLAEDLEL